MLLKMAGTNISHSCGWTWQMTTNVKGCLAGCRSLSSTVNSRLGAHGFISQWRISTMVPGSHGNHASNVYQEEKLVVMILTTSSTDWSIQTLSQYHFPNMPQSIEKVPVILFNWLGVDAPSARSSLVGNGFKPMQRFSLLCSLVYPQISSFVSCLLRVPIKACYLLLSHQEHWQQRKQIQHSAMLQSNNPELFPPAHHGDHPGDEPSLCCESATHPSHV